ncbi:hypothetical protein D9757_010315 [Collybiopsis confluens]|uniref:Uncharacterized protein n=1 Tax=Collybiopsis confluens TaxID=2823264 RepID=A0A8H5GU57_9AGAR|nr:hypothetical protein D9757_010315 [Collybiopsis confluens]
MTILQNLTRDIDDYKQVPGLILSEDTGVGGSSDYEDTTTDDSDSDSSGKDPVQNQSESTHLNSNRHAYSNRSPAPSPERRALTLADFTSPYLDNNEILQMTLSLDPRSVDRIRSELVQGQVRGKRTRRAPSSMDRTLVTQIGSSSSKVSRDSRTSSSGSLKRRKVRHESQGTSGHGQACSPHVDHGSSLIVPNVKGSPAFKMLPASKCTLPLARFNRSRRLLCPGPDFAVEYPLTTVSMKGDIQFIDRQNQQWHRPFSIPNSDNVPYNVEDACVVENLVVIAYREGPHQLSTIKIPEISCDQRPRISYSSSSTSSPIRALAPVPSISTFNGKTAITAGEDKVVRVWSLEGSSLDSDSTSDSDSEDGATTTSLIIDSGATSSTVGVMPHRVQCIAARESKLYSSRGKILRIDDVNGRGWSTSSGSRRRQESSNVFANSIIHIHAPLGAGDQNFIFTDHPRAQIGLYDIRKDIRAEGEDISFGYIFPDSYKHTKYFKGSPETSLSTYKYVRGYPDGVVCLFDWRNPKAPVAQTCARRSSGKEIFHTIFADFCIPHSKNKNRTMKGVVTFGGGELDFLDLSLNACHSSTRTPKKLN